MALTQTQLPSAVADRAELSNTGARRALAAFEEIVLEQLANAEKVRIGGLVQLTVRVKPAQKKRVCRMPHTCVYVAPKLSSLPGAEDSVCPRVGC